MINCNTMVALWLCLFVSGCTSITVPQETARIVTDQTFGRYQENLEGDLILITMTPEYHALYTDQQAVPMSGTLPPLYAQFLARVESDFGIKRVANWPLAAIDIFCVVFEIQDPARKAEVVAALALEPDIETAQTVQSFDSQAGEYNDPYLPIQHGFHAIQALSSHRWSRGKGVRIAVIDTGMDDTHPDLVASSEQTRNFVDDDEAAFRTDIHGTALGGLIAAEADNETGMVGIAPDAALLAIKACWYPNQDPEHARCNTLTLAKSLNYSIEQKVDIINLSLTGPPDPILERLVLMALSQGIVVVGARPAHDNAAFPVSVPGTIAVDLPDNRTSVISAPGRRVLSTQPDRDYDFFDGSSFSTAHVSGLAALVRSLTPDISPKELHALLMETANPVTGEANACRAVLAVRHRGNLHADGENCP